MNTSPKGASERNPPNGIDPSESPLPSHFRNQEPLIAAAWRDRLHAYLGGVIRTLDGVPEAVGGVADHVHLLVGLRATHTLADVLRETKSVSSAWVHDDVGVTSFAWQEGYGAFTVST